MEEISFITFPKAEFPRDYFENIAQLRAEWYEESYRLPAPSTDYFVKHLGVTIPTHRFSFWTLARNRDSEIIGYGNIAGNLSGDNKDKADVEIFVRKGKERDKNRTLILKELTGKINNEVTHIRISFTKNTSESIQFESKYKIKPNITSIMSVSQLAQFTYDEIKRIVKKNVKKVKERGYSLILLENYDFHPKINTSEYARIVEEIINDVPQENLTTEREIYSEQRLQEDYRYWQNEGMKALTCVAVKNNTDNPVGFTHTNLSNYHKQVATQMLTGVVRKHRGHGLGLALKYQMLLKLLENREIEYWFTSNAQVNAPMRRINELLGYKQWLTRAMYEVKIQDL